MKQLLDFFPLLVFFGFYQYSKSIVTATAALIVATVIQVSYLWLRHRKVEKTQLITLVVVLVFGGLTVALHDDTFIKWKPTIINWLLAIVLLGSQWFAGKNIIRGMLEKEINLPKPVWSHLNLAWALFFVLSGILNLYVAFSFSEPVWVKFKVFGLFGLTILFAILQVAYLSRYFKHETDPSE